MTIKISRVVSRQPAIRFSISFQHPFIRAGGRTSNVQKNLNPLLMIKHLISIAFTIFALIPAAIAADADISAQFTRNLRAAITEKDNQKLEALIYSEGASPADKQRTNDTFQKILQKDIEEIRLEPLPNDYDVSIFIFRGQKIEPTAPPKGLVKMTFKRDEYGKGNLSSAYTVVNGKFFLVGMKSTDLGWKGQPDKNIGYSVDGQGASAIHIHGVWNASGVQMKRVFKGPNLTFWGQYFEELTVTSENDDCDVTVTITEDDKTIFSERLKGKGVLQYKKKS